jgi:hypothetical protein
VQRNGWSYAGTLLLIPVLVYSLITGADLMTVQTRSTVTTVKEIESTKVIDVVTDGTIRVLGRTDGIAAVTINRKARSGLTTPTFSEKQVGDKMIVRGSCSFLSGSVCRIDLTISVPPTLRLTANSSSGGVKISGISADINATSSAGNVTILDSTGSMVLRSSAGDISFTRVGGSIDASSSAGTVTGKGLRANTVNARSSASKVRLEFNEAPLNVKATSSADSVLIALPRGSETYKVSARAEGNPKIEVRTDPSSSRTVAAKSTAGGVRVIYSDTLED